MTLAQGRPTDAQLLVREEPVLRRIISRYVHDPVVVDDIFQDVGVKVIRHLHTARDEAALRGWIYQIARNACLDWLRARGRRKDVRIEDINAFGAKGDAARAPGDRLVSNERMDAIRRCLAELPESQREVIRLRVEEDLDHEAISARLGISRQAVEVRLCRGRAALKEKLEEILDGDL